MVIQEINPLEMASLHIVYGNLSPLDETHGYKGTSHLIEHMIGTSIEPIIDELHVNGIDEDFYTNHEHVVASFKGTAAALEEMASKIVDTVVHTDACNLLEAQFECERQSIINEICEYRSDAVSDTLRRGIFDTFGILPPEGNLDDVNKYSYSEFVKAYNEKVHHPTKIVYVGPRKISLPEVEFSTQPNIQVSFNEPKPRELKIPQFEKGDFCTVGVVGAKPVIGDRDYAAMQIAMTMLGGDSESVLYNDLRVNNGLVYDCTAAMEPMRNLGVLMFFTNTKAESVKDTVDRMQTILSNPTDYFTEAKFDRVKKWMGMKLKEKQIMRFASVGDLIRGGMITEMHDILNISYDEMLETVREYLKPDTLRFYFGH